MRRFGFTESWDLDSWAKLLLSRTGLEYISLRTTPQESRHLDFLFATPRLCVNLFRTAFADGLNAGKAGTPEVTIDGIHAEAPGGARRNRRSYRRLRMVSSQSFARTTAKSN